MNFLNKFIKKFQSSEKNLEQSATNNLKISPNLDEFVKKELVPGLNISSDYFWKTFEDIVERFSERNRELLNERENLQKKIDDWHIQNKDFKGMPRILEINPDHNIIKKLNKIKDTDKDALNDASFLLFDQAKMVEGELPNDIAKFNQRMSKFLGIALS